MPKQVDDQTILRIMREEWTTRKSGLVTEVKLVAERESKKAEDISFDTVSIGLKIKHKESGVLYTVNQVSPGSVTLRSPEGALAVIPNASLEAEFELA